MRKIKCCRGLLYQTLVSGSSVRLSVLPTFPRSVRCTSFVIMKSFSSISCILTTLDKLVALENSACILISLKVKGQRWTEDRCDDNNGLRCDVQWSRVRIKAEEAVNEVKRQAVAELHRAVTAAEVKATVAVTAERARLEKVVNEVRAQARQEAFTLLNSQEDSTEVRLYEQAKRSHHRCTDNISAAEISLKVVHGHRQWQYFIGPC